jgi:hypothetical protein
MSNPKAMYRTADILARTISGMFAGTVFSAVFFCLEMMVALFRDVDCGCCWRNALNEWIKVLVHRQRPFVDGPFVDWSGYSCF